MEPNNQIDISPEGTPIKSKIDNKEVISIFAIPAVLIIAIASFIYLYKPQKQETQLVVPIIQDARFEFEYSQESELKTLNQIDAIQADIIMKLSNNSNIDHFKISIGIDASKTTSETCMPKTYKSPVSIKQMYSEEVSVGNNVFYKYASQNIGGCAGGQCDSGYLYTIWRDNTCYGIENWYFYNRLEKMYSCSADFDSDGFSKSCNDPSDYPKYIGAKKSQKKAEDYIDKQIVQILSTFKFKNDTVTSNTNPTQAPIVQKNKYDDFATCLKDNGAKFYGAFWCPHCQSQKTLFGKSASLLPYVECSTPNAQSQTQVCIDKKIMSYPTWEFSDGSVINGELDFQTLSQKTNCELPE